MTNLEGFINNAKWIPTVMNSPTSPNALLSGEILEFIAQLSAEEEIEKKPAPLVDSKIHPTINTPEKVIYDGVTIPSPTSPPAPPAPLQRPLPSNDSTEQLAFPKKVETSMLPPVPVAGVPVADKQDYYQNEKGGDQYIYTQVKDAQVIANPSPTSLPNSPYEDGDKPTEPNEEKGEVKMDEKKEIGVPKVDEHKPTDIPTGDSKYTEKGPGIVDGKSTFLETSEKSETKMEEKKEIGVPEKVETVAPTKVGSKELDPAADRFAHLEAEIEMLKSKLPKPEALPAPRVSSGEIISPPIAEKQKLPDMKNLERAIDDKFLKHMIAQEGVSRI
jgi:hypothetical protein